MYSTLEGKIPGRIQGTRGSYCGEKRKVATFEPYQAIRRIGYGGDVKIGDFCSIGAGCRWLSTGHYTGHVSTYPFKGPKSIVNYGDLKIGNDVWVGNDVLFIGGLVIGSGAVIGAGSVVRDHIVPYGVAEGNPAEVYRFRFPLDQVTALCNIRWWEWSDEKIFENRDLLASGNVQEFIKQHKEDK